MNASERQLEFAVEWLDVDPTKLTAKIVAVTPRAKAWLDHRGALAVAERVNAMNRPGREVAEAIQDLLEEDAGIAPTELAGPEMFLSGATADFAIEFEDFPGDEGDRIATIVGLSPRARDWLTHRQGHELVWRVNKVQRPGETMLSVYQRLLEADLD